MNKFLFGLLAMGIISCTSRSGAPFTVEGTIRNSPEPIIYLEQNLANNERPLIVDSSRIGSDNAFRLATTTKEEGIYSLRAGHAPLPFAVLINDSKKLRVNADLSASGQTYTVSGSAASEELIRFDKMIGSKLELLAQYNRNYDSILRIKAIHPDQQRTLDSLRKADSIGYESVAEQMKNNVLDLTRKNISPSLTTYAVTTFQQIAERYGLKSFTPTEIADIVTKAVAKFPENSTLQDWKKSLRTGKAPEFTLADTSGAPISLSSLKGKYVLIDFWASWCRPCRMENPNVVAAYNQFKEKNFSILGVSLDTSRQAWIDAIHLDGLTWNHASDLKGWESKAASIYGVQSIPYNFLIDPDGNIIAERLTGTELESKLREVLK